MEENIRMTFPGGILDQYQMDLLSMELCSLFLRMSFVQGEDLTVYVKAEEYRFPDVLCENSASEVLLRMESLLREMIMAERRYFEIGTYRVSMDVFMIRRKDNTGHLLYIPHEYPGKRELYKDLCDIFLAFLDYVPEKDRGYLEQACDYFRGGRSGIGIIRHRIERLAYEANACGC